MRGSIRKQSYIKSKNSNHRIILKGAGGENVEKTKEANVTVEIKAQEWQIIKLIRDLDYGQLVVSVKNGKPVHVESRKSITLNP